MARRKSTHSGAMHNCVEVDDDWRKATASAGGNCAEVAAWRKASGCQTGECVEVATIPVLAVRDTEDDGTGPVLVFTGEQWRAFLSQVRARLGSPINRACQVTSSPSRSPG